MKKILLNKSLFILTLLWSCTSWVGKAQTPAPDLDSITEDSYQRMLIREKADQQSDTLILSRSAPVLNKPAQKEWEWWYVLLGVEILVVMLLVLGRGQKKSHPEERLKK